MKKSLFFLRLEAKLRKKLIGSRGGDPTEEEKHEKGIISHFGRVASAIELDRVLTKNKTRSR